MLLKPIWRKLAIRLSIAWPLLRPTFSTPWISTLR